jgi:hypothetical protein
MNDEAAVWVEYAIENFQSVQILIESRIFNPNNGKKARNIP